MPLFLKLPDLIHEKCLRVHPMMLTLPILRCSENSCDHSGKSRNKPPSTGSMSFFLCSVCSESCSWSPNTRLRVLLRRLVAGLGVESSTVKSCGNDVGDVLAVELEEAVDNPGTTIGT